MDRQLKAVALDCYGTLVHITQPRDVPAQIKSLVGGRIIPSPMMIDKPLIDLVRAAAPHAPTADLDRLEADIRAEVASIEIIKGANTAILDLKNQGYVLALASNLARDYGQAIIDLIDIEIRAFSYQIGATKPHRIFYEQLCTMLSAKPDQVLMVGDSFTSDYSGATAAGLSAVHLSQDLTGVPTIRTIADLPEWVETLL